MDINKEKIDQVLSKSVESNSPVISAAVLSSEETLYRGDFGLADIATGKNVQKDSIFRIASMTKAITSTCTMQLIEKEKLSLETKLKEFFPEIADKKILEGFNKKNEPLLSEASSDLTIKQLLTHTSGFAYEVWNENVAAMVENGDLATAFSGDDNFLKAPLSFNPGSSWEYGIGIDWLGVLVEKISDMTLQDYMKKYIFNPLGMIDTSYDVPKEKIERLVKVHSRNGEEYLEMPFDPPEKSDFYSGGGNLVSTLSDYSSFLNMFLNQGKSSEGRILQKTSVDLMLTSHTGELLMTSMQTSAPILSNDVDFFPDTDKSWGLGFMINNEDIENGRPKGSAGWAGLFNSYFWIDPKNKIAAVILMQMLPFAEEGCLKTLKDFEKSIYS